MAHMMLEAKRATRGKRMNLLVGQAAEDDDAFWGNEVWEEGEGSDEDSFHTADEEEKPDEFDSDFNESETEDEEDEDEEAEKAAQKGGRVQSKATNRYKDPAFANKSKAKGIKNPFAEAEKAENGSMDVDGVEIDNSEEPSKPKESVKMSREKKIVMHEMGERTVRSSTKSKTQLADIEREKKEEEEKKKRRPINPKPTKAHFKFQDMLEEALKTEDENRKWLENRKFWLQHKEEQEKKISSAGENFVNDYIRYFSKRNVGTYVTFSSQNAIPQCLRDEANQPPPPPPDNICVITGLPAKYRDPKTLLPYANAAAFRELRRQYEGGRVKVPSSTSRKHKSAAPVIQSSHQKAALVRSAKEVTEDATAMDCDDNFSTMPHSTLPRSLEQSSFCTVNGNQQAMPQVSSTGGVSPHNFRNLSESHSHLSLVEAGSSARSNSEFWVPLDDYERAKEDKEIAEAIELGKPRRDGNNCIYIASHNESSTSEQSLPSIQPLFPPGVVLRPRSEVSKSDASDEQSELVRFLGADIAALVAEDRARQMQSSGSTFVLKLRR